MKRTHNETMKEEEEPITYKEVAKPIGAGGFGTIFQLSSNKEEVIKAIYSRESCHEAQIEYMKQQRIYNSFKRLKENKGEEERQSPIIKMVNKLVKISKPISYMDRKAVINNRIFACTITMTKLNGIPLRDMINIDKNVLNRFDKEFIEERTLDFEIMAHLALNSDIGGVYGITFGNKALVSDKNPPRGYFITEESGLLDNIREMYNVDLTDSDFKQIIGFIYGRIMFDTNIIPIDIEIALGLYGKNKNKIKINVLDFGMTFDLENIRDNKVLPRTSLFFDIINDESLSPNEKSKEILEKGKEDISIDLYCDVLNDNDNIIGFNEAYNVSLSPSYSFIQGIGEEQYHCFICSLNTKLYDDYENRFFCNIECQRIYYNNYTT